VFVEETSFRAKSIEGVSTSTTGFAGPARRGPIGDTPVLLTSFLDYQRIYGGLDNLRFSDATGARLNLLAHSVRAYFDNGGGRLYVARTYNGTGGASVSADLAAGIRFVARFPGAAGDGSIRVRELTTRAAGLSLASAPVGSLIRVGAATPATGGRITGGRPPFAVSNDARLLLTVGTTDSEIVFHGEPTEALAAADVPANVTLGTSNVLTVVIDGAEQQITLPAAATPRAAIVDAINRGLRGAFASLDGNRLVIGSDTRGRESSVTIRASSAGTLIGVTADVTETGDTEPANTVGRLHAVTADDINALLTAGGIAATASLDGAGNLVLAATGTGATAGIRVRPATLPVVSAHGQLGIADGASGSGTAGGTTSLLRKVGAQWLDSTGAATAVTGDAHLVTLTVVTRDGDLAEKAFDELGFDPDHPRYVGSVLSRTPNRRAEQLENMYALELPDPRPTAFALHAALFPAGGDRTIPVTGGSDGGMPVGVTYEGALGLLGAIEDISIVAAPGSSSFPDHQAIQLELIEHVEARRRYRIAVLDTRDISRSDEAQEERSRLDSTRAALYTPWVIISNPLQKPGDDSIPKEVALPPSGFVCGIYARNDVQRGVFKAPANEVVRGALRHSLEINFAQQETLNPVGINCLRFFPNRGNRVWGARTLSSDPEWKYVNVRRYFNYLERSIDIGTQWAVFEPNGERLWANVRETISSFLVNEWRSGALLGTNPKEAFFVRCDRSTMDQNDLDNGRLVCLIGVAVVKPAEFVIFRIGQKTADARN
jgi:phage tail sheath protein FI